VNYKQHPHRKLEFWNVHQVPKQLKEQYVECRMLNTTWNALYGMPGLTEIMLLKSIFKKHCQADLKLWYEQKGKNDLRACLPTNDDFYKLVIWKCHKYPHLKVLFTYEHFEKEMMGSEDFDGI